MKRNWPNTVTINHRRWRLQCGGLATKEGGDCDPPSVKNKKIRITGRARNCNLLRIAIHEFLHAADWDRAEESVEQISDDLAKALWKMGIRWNWEANYKREI